MSQMSLKYFNLVFLIIVLELFSPSDTNQWYQTYCEDSLCLYFNSTSIYAQSNEEANNICSKSGLMLLEIPNATVQEIVDRATKSWDNYVRPLIGFFFRLNLVQVVEQNWKWISTNQPLDSTESISSYPYFAIVQKNSSGIYFFTEFERSKYPSICSCDGTCKNSGSCSMRDSGSNFCYEVVSTAANWFESRSNCQYMGGDLATVIKNPLPQWISNVPAGSYWIGLTKAKYVWGSTGQTSNYFKWFDGEPIQGHDCTYISHSDYKSPNYFRKAPCNEGKPFFCMNGTGNYIQTFVPLTSPQFSTSSSAAVTLPSTSTTTSSVSSTTTSTSIKGKTEIKDVQNSTTGSSDSSPVGIIAGVVTSGIVLIVLAVIVLFFVFRYLNKNKKNKSSAYHTTIDDLGRKPTNPYETEISIGNRGTTVYGPYDNLDSHNVNKYDVIDDGTIYDELSETSPYDKLSEDTDSKYCLEITCSDVTTLRGSLNESFSQLASTSSEEPTPSSSNSILYNTSTSVTSASTSATSTSTSATSTSTSAASTPTSATSTSTSAASTPTSATSTSTSATSTSTSAANTPTSGTSTSFNSSSVSKSTSNSTESTKAPTNNPDISLAIGLGVGIPLGVLAIAAVAGVIICALKRKRNKKGDEFFSSGETEENLSMDDYANSSEFHRNRNSNADNVYSNWSNSEQRGVNFANSNSRGQETGATYVNLDFSNTKQEGLNYAKLDFSNRKTLVPAEK